jgi:hypothetical protein
MKSKLTFVCFFHPRKSFFHSVSSNDSIKPILVHHPSRDSSSSSSGHHHHVHVEDDHHDDEQTLTPEEQGLN